MRTLCVILLLLSCARVTHACRLDHALTHVALSGPYAPNWLLESDLEAAAFDLDGTAGHYQRLTTRFEYFGLRHLDLGVSVLWASVDRRGTPSDVRSLGNPVLHARHARAPWTGGRVSAGLQLELPWGGARAVAADHTELLPQVGIAHEGELFGAFARLGLRWSVGGHANADVGDHDHARDDLQLVDPHAERELLYRIGWSMHAVRSPWTHAIYVDGLRVLHGALPGDRLDQFTLGLQTGYKLSWKTFVHPGFELPLSQPARRDWRLSLTWQRLL